MVAPFGDTPGLVVLSTDRTRIAVFSGGSGDGAPVLLVHGTGSDHTTWRVVAPLLALGRLVHAMDRRGRGASGDGASYAAAREAEDVAAVADALAADCGAPVAVVGHSLGGRLALAASLRSDAIARVIAYESAPAVRDAAGRAADEQLLEMLRAGLAASDRDAVLSRFLREAASLPADQLAAFRASDLWPVRAATAPQIVRELDAALHDPAIGIVALGRVPVPVLQLGGTASPARFRDGMLSLDRRLAHGRVEFIDGAGHNAHHTHAGAFAATVSAYVDG